MKKYIDKKKKELENLKLVEHDAETQQILMEHSKQAANNSPIKDNPDIVMDDLVISYYNDAELKRHKVIQEKEREPNISTLSIYLQKTEGENYDPLELSQKKKKYMKEVKNEISNINSLK